MRLIYCFIFLLAVCMITGCQDQQKSLSKSSKPLYTIGYMICNNEEETLQRFQPLTDYLAKQLDINLQAVAIDTMDYSNKIDSLHFTHTNSLLYIMLHRYHAVDVLAVEKRGELGDRSRGIVAALKTSHIKNLDDLRGKTMIFGPMLAPTSYMSQVYALKQHGFDIDRDLAIYNFPRGSYKHEKVIYGVLFQRYDAGAFPYWDFEIMAKQGKIDREDFTILAEGPLIPYCNFGYTQRVDEKLARRFQKILLSITENDTVQSKGERVRILERAQLQGFSAVTDQDFNIVRDMARETNMPPYQQY